MQKILSIGGGGTRALINGRRWGWCAPFCDRPRKFDLDNFTVFHGKTRYQGDDTHCGRGE